MLTTLLYLFLGFNLVKILMEKTNTIYKDIRFWLAIISLITLVWMTVKSYPAG
ncbi:MAG: hypothetical protein H6577_01840 [Lewinellaceae bacterium]|nr:hypothetical protein [Saprospiraceae bacterium]MCB9336849.1 hypothetical protein [Lewinellaceae bacterium]